MKRKTFFGIVDDVVSGVGEIISQSTKAVCGVTEREVSVRSEDVARTKATLKSKGFVIIGTSEPGTKFRKIWFIRAGGF